MLNFIALGLASLPPRPGRSAAAKAGSADRHHHGDPRVRLGAGLNGILGALGLANPPRQLYGFLIIAIVRRHPHRVLLNRTRFGFDLQASGLSPSAARASGVNARGMVVKTMLLSGAIAGLIGLPDLLGPTHAYTTNFTAGLGFLGIAVALLGRNKPGRHRAGRAAVRLPRPVAGAAADRRLPGVGRHDLPGHDRARGRHRQRVARRVPRRAAERGTAQRRRPPVTAAGARPDAAARRIHRRAPGGAGMSTSLTTPEAPGRRPVTDLLTGGGPRPARALAARSARWCCSRSSGRSAARTRLTSSSTMSRRPAARRADRPGRAGRAVLRARRRGQHRPRGHDDPRHLGRRLGRLPVGLGGRARRRRARSAPSAACCTRSPR